MGLFDILKTVNHVVHGSGYPRIDENPMVPFYNKKAEELGDKVIDYVQKKVTDSTDDDKYERTSSSIHAPHRGDVIGIRRNGFIDYKHFAIYAGNNSVIHYAPDSSGEITIHQAPMSEFLGNNHSKTYFVCNFPKSYGRPEEVDVPSNEFTFGYGGATIPYNMVSHLIKNFNYHLYSAEETMNRAKSRLGENEYNLFTNNCEFFALWCKTNISESHQVEDLLKVLNPSPDVFF